MTTTWAFGGTDLSTYGRVTVVSDYLTTAQRRGENIEIPFRHGRIFVPKYYDERHITIGMAIQKSTEALLETELDTLRAKLSPKTEQVLAQTRADATVRNANACVDSPFEIERFGDKIAKIVIDFTLSSPFFRLSTAIADNTTTIDTTPHAMTVTNPGTIEERDPVILLTGPLKNTVITNSTNGCIMAYTGTINAGATVTIGTLNGEFYATHSVSGDVISGVTHSGSSALMVFDVGANTLSIADETHTTGTVRASFYAPYI